MMPGGPEGSYAMEGATARALRHELTERQVRLRGALAAEGPHDDIVRLLQQVDTALDRLGTGDYGRCLVCNGRIEEKDLKLNPLLQYCLCDLTPGQQRELENDLDLARRIQSSLLPDPGLAWDGWEASYRYEPLGVVSGDYCDLWRPEAEGSIYFAVGDVSGKGVAASLLMAHLQAAFRSLVGAGVPLADLVQRVNRQLLEAGIPTHYATLACGRAAADGEVEIVNAGHCPPLLVRKNGVEEVGPSGFPVGLLADHPYELQRVRLLAGDSLVLYTDGLTEAREAGGDEYGQERLARLLAPAFHESSSRRILETIREDLDRFSEGPRLDDLTILVLKKRG